LTIYLNFDIVNLESEDNKNDKRKCRHK